MLESPVVSRAPDALAEGKVALPDEATDWGQPPVPEPLAGTSAHPSTNQVYFKLEVMDESRISLFNGYGTNQ